MSTSIWLLIGLAALAGGLIVLAAQILSGHRVGPEKRERRRRMMLNAQGRFRDGMLTDVGPDSVFYSYSVAGVQYRTSQDIRDLSEWLPPDREAVIGPVTLKYLPQNPANSIVVCEGWSGLRTVEKETVSE
jgi:hypothetical protein